jgi:hypothetical protein
MHSQPNIKFTSSLHLLELNSQKLCDLCCPYYQCCLIVTSLTHAPNIQHMLFKLSFFIHKVGIEEVGILLLFLLVLIIRHLVLSLQQCVGCVSQSLIHSSCFVHQSSAVIQAMSIICNVAGRTVCV